ncbi:MAG: glycosyltransferase [Candidatus Omnitrophica bacterium]|nr:glycosyltransferase [Candidatus Omnitrophota bacterium]
MTPAPQATPAVLGVVVSQFPELHETFITRELAALRDAGVVLRIYSLKRCRDRFIHAEAQTLLSCTVYLPWDQVRVWWRAAVELARHPWQAATTLGWTLRHHAWPPRTVAKALVVWVQAMALARQMRRDGVARLHAHWATMPATAAAIAARWLRLSWSFTAHAWDLFVPNPSLAAKVRLADRVLTCTAYNRAHLARICPDAQDKMLLNYHGVDLARFTRAPAAASAGAPLLLSIGRLVETKGFDTLLEAYHRLRRRGVAFRAVIIGEGPGHRRLQRQIEAFGLADSVELRPVAGQEALRQWYADAFAFVLPCAVARNGDRDGIPNVILEAMAMGKPVISTTISGVPEAVQDQHTGLLVPPARPDLLADVLAWLLERPQLAQVMGQEGRRWVERHFDDRIHAQRLVTHMKALCEPRPRKVMYLIWSLEVGGAERVVVSLAQGLDRRRFTPLVVCLNQAGRLAELLRRQGVEVVALHKRPGIDLVLLWRLTRLMRRTRPAIVHTHLWGANFWGRWAARLAAVPIIIAHEHGMQPWRGRLHFRLDRWLAGVTRRVLFVSREVLAGYVERIGIAPARCTLVPNGVACEGLPDDRARLRQQLGWGADDRVIINVGRLSPEKGHADLLEAFAMIVQHVRRARLILVGDGPQRPALERLQERLHLNGEVTYARTQEDVTRWLAAADVYVQPSRREGLPLAVLEAMATGLPVIATRVGDVERLITDGHDGYLVPAGDPYVLATKLLAVLREPDGHRAMAAQAQRLVRSRYSSDHMLRAVVAIYEEELARWGGPR